MPRSANVCPRNRVRYKEAFKPKAAKVPNVCDYFSVHYTNVEGFLKKNNWTF